MPQELDYMRVCRHPHLEIKRFIFLIKYNDLMKIMDTLIGSYKKKPKQDRAAKTEQDLLYAANEILDKGKLDDLSAKVLSEKSGYSIGVIYKYFNKYEDIFIKIFLQKVDAHFKEVEQIYVDHQPNETVSDLFNKVINHGFLFVERYGKLQNKLIPLFRFFMRRHKTPEDFYKVTDRLAPFTLILQANDKTGTFKKMSEMECILKHRAFDHYLRTPFIDAQNKFSSSEHKKSCLEFAVLIFSVSNN
jgi:AcrR family transcriptional regulator